LVALVDRVLRRLQKEHLTVELKTSGGQPSRKVVLGSFDVGWVTSSYIMAFPAVSTLPTLYRALDAGDVTHPEVQRMASAIAAFRTGSIGSAMSIMMDCYSGVAEDRYGRILREEQQTVLGRLIDFPFPEACTAWGSPDLGAKFRRPVRSRVPALLFSGDLDARTPPSSAEATMAGLVNAKHIVITRGMHGDSYFLASPEIRERMAAFLRGDEISTRSIEAPALRFLP
jgi:pimeloyl-ACP methyl ester carboxylesterase